MLEVLGTHPVVFGGAWVKHLQGLDVHGVDGVGNSLVKVGRETWESDGKETTV